MKLTKIESYEIQAFAFRMMTGYMAPGKDSSPLADEAPYEERCAAWDEWRNKYAHCILAMLHGFEALIDRDDEPTGALLDRLRAAEAEVERLRHDIERHIAIASEYATECERLRAELAEVATAIGSDRYLDPPDGGSVPLSEQVRRMRAENQSAYTALGYLSGLAPSVEVNADDPMTMAKEISEYVTSELTLWRGRAATMRAELAECRDALAKIGPYYVPSTELSDDEVNAMYAMIDAARKGEEE